MERIRLGGISGVHCTVTAAPVSIVMVAGAGAGWRSDREDKNMM